MSWTVARKQLLTNLLSYKFVIGFLLCQILFVSSALILTRDYEERLAAFNSAVSRHTGELHQTRVYSQLSVTLDRRPEVLSPISEGFDKRFADSVTASYTSIPTLGVGQSEKNPLLVVLKSFDLISIVQIVLGLLAILFGYDAVSGERERGTLALALSNSLPRHAFLLGQCIGGILTLLPMFLTGMLLALFILNASPSVALTTADWLGMVSIVLISLLYLSALYLIGLLLSVLAGSSSTALVLGLFFWVAFIILAPNMAAHLAGSLRPSEPKSIADSQARELRSELWQRLALYAQQHPRPAHRWEFIKGRQVYTGDVPYPIAIFFAPREVMLWEQEGLKFCLRLEMEYSERIHEVYRQGERTAAAQASLARSLALVSPGWIYYQGASVLAGTEADGFLRFLEHARQYRRNLIQYVQNRDGLFSAAYFTRADILKLPSTTDLLAVKAARGQAAVDALIQWQGWDAVPPLDLRDLPGWELPPAAGAGRVAAALPFAGGLFLLNVLCFFAAHLAFARADVRAN